MAKPCILCLDDDSAVLRAIQRDVRQRYAEKYRVLAAPSGQVGLDTLQQLKARGESVALLLADQRMPGMDGVDFLERARSLYPDSKRALLTAYADNEAAIRAINRVRLDYYLMKPWDPPDERLYPVLDDLLEDWGSGYRPAFEGIRVLGLRWSPDSHAVRDFLARHQIPFQWLDVETRAAECDQLLAALGGQRPGFPLLLFPGGEPLVRPTLPVLAERIGMRTRAERKFYDLAIVGGGPAGLGAAVNASSEGLRTLLIEREAPGGQAGTSSRIENYMGFPSGLSGADLTRRAVAQAQRFGTEILAPQEVKALRAEDRYRILTLADGSEVAAHAVMLAMGVQWRRLALDGIERFHGAGVYYGASLSEAAACAGEDVYIIGGANSAGQAAVHFCKYARQVTMLVRADSLTKSMSQYLIDQIAGTPNITVRLQCAVTAVQGSDKLEQITVSDFAAGTELAVPCSSLFVFIGAEPRTSWLDGTVERDQAGFILTAPILRRGHPGLKNWPLDREPYLLETSLPGVFCAGDVRAGSIKRVASAAGQGGIGVEIIHDYLARL
ncbi:MAG: FAD-dependent oxidoreductase [Verrucomicrobia bacterium]|nr:FAD-dependent oxidoreductase [Verrucomicrobiota bacterium]